MKILSLKWAVLLGLVAVLTIAAVACGGDEAEPDDDSVAQETEAMEEDSMEEPAEPMEPFKVGVMESLTGPGETYGNLALQAKQLAVDEINAAGGVNGRMLELVVEDSKCNALRTQSRRITS